MLKFFLANFPFIKIMKMILSLKFFGNFFELFWRTTLAGAARHDIM
jgi:hypothetical protein